jgi:eukaryotic-like serine/threonine-protein kinase
VNAVDEQPDERIGREIGRWRVEKLLGSGGMASVYAAVDASGARVALKVLHPEMARRSDVRERFLREAYVANRIGHPGVVRVLEHGQDTETFLAMELLEGEPLSARAQRPNDFTLRELLGYAVELLDILAVAHEKGVIHRDIKPDNVWVTTEGRVKMLDFGIARVMDDVPSDFKTRTGLALGTIPYMAPEQALGRRGQVDGRTDLFATGALLFRILAGRRVHDEPSEAELLVAMATKPAPKLATAAANVPADVCAIVDNALAFSREARYPDARTMQADIRAVLAGEVPPHAVAGVGAVRDAPTRIESAAGAAAGPVSAHAPTQPATQVLSQAVPPSAPAPVPVDRAATPVEPAAAPVDRAPASLGLAPTGFAPLAASAAVDVAPVSLAPSSLAAPPASVSPVSYLPTSLATPAVAAMPGAVRPAPRSSRAALLVVFALGGLLVMALLVVGGFYFFVRETPSETTALSAAPRPSAAASVAGELPSPSALPSEVEETPAAAATAGRATSHASNGLSAGTTPPKATAAAVAPKTTTVATTTATTQKTLPAPTATTPATTHTSAPAPTTPPSPPEDKGKGKKGHSKK